VEYSILKNAESKGMQREITRKDETGGKMNENEDSAISSEDHSINEWVN
jgi:hypothetical protein